MGQFADQMAAFENDIDSAKPNGDDDDNAQSTNDDANGQSQNNNGNGGNEDMNPEEAMKFFQQLIGMQNQTDEQKNDFAPNLNDLPKLNEEEMKQFKEMMNQDGCLIQ